MAKENKEETENDLIVLEVGDEELRFNKSNKAYGTYIDTIGKGKLKQGANNYCIETIHGEDRSKLRSMIAENPGLPLQLAGTLADLVAPDMEVTVKKR